MLAVLEPPVGAQGAQERLLEEVLRPLAAGPPAEQGENLAPVGLVEQLEGRDSGAGHRALKRTPRSRCET